MVLQLEQLAEENKLLRRCINDLFNSLPADRGGGERAEIADALIEALFGMLGLDLIYVRLVVAANEAPVEMVRVAQSLSLKAGPREGGELFDRWSGDDPQKWPALVRDTIGDGDLTIVPLRLGLQGEVGIIVAGSRRADFPRHSGSPGRRPIVRRGARPGACHRQRL